MTNKYQVYIRNDWPLPFIQPWAEGPTHIAKPPFQWKSIIVANLGDKYAWCYYLKDIIKIGHEADFFLTKRNNLKNFIKQAKQAEKLNRKISSQILKLNLNGFTVKELAKLLQKWQKAHNLFATRFMPIDATDETLEIDIRNSLQKNNINLSLNEMACLLTPNIPTYVQREHTDFVRLAKKYSEYPHSPKVKKAVSEHANKWWWTVMGWGQHQPLTETAIIKKINRAHAVEKLVFKQSREERIRRTTLTIKQQVFKKIPQETKKFLAAFEVLAEMHDTRKEIQMKMMTAGFAITKAMLKKCHIPFRYCRFMLLEEYIELANNIKPSLKELNERICSYWCEFTNGGKTHLYSGKRALKKIKTSKIAEKNKNNSPASIQGQPASPGFVQGKVRVALNANILNRAIKPGEILVTSQTTPEFAPAMKKASAIVTDEGGITSHAAIVSRELGIPCIIGTKNATKVFKDGDIVEVDANKGIVRKI